MIRGHTYDLPVKEKKVENKRGYYVVEAEGQEYAIRLFEFQLQEPAPEFLKCMVKDIHEGVPTLIQDFGPLLQRFYKEGETYPFLVKNDYTDVVPPYYEVADGNGFRFRLIYYDNATLMPKQRISCRVRSLRGHRLSLELVREAKETEEADCFFIPDDLLKAIGVSPHFVRWMEGRFRNRPEFAEAREAFARKRGEWLLMVMDVLNHCMAGWLRLGSRHNALFLDYYAKACLYLLEESSSLAAYPEEERLAYRRQLAEAVRNTEYYRHAIDLAENGKQEEYIDGLLGKIRRSGYVYRAEERFRVLACVFSLDGRLMRDKMGDIFATILEGKPQDWQNAPYRHAFLNLLDLYVQENRSSIDHIAVPDTSEAQQAVARIVTALALGQLLATPDDAYDHRLNRAMLYRYSALLKKGNPHVLLEKAFRCLSNVQLGVLEYDWNDMKDPTLLCIKLSCRDQEWKQENTSMTQTYEHKNVQLRIMNNTVQLLPSRELKKTKKALPEWLLPWHQLQVLLEKNMAGDIGRDTRDLTRYRKMWKEVEYSLFHNPDPVPQQRRQHKVLPEKGEMVTIRVLEPDPKRPDYFRCRIEDDTFYGEGWLCLRNVVRYELHVGMDAFCSDMGKPYLLRAEVQGVNGRDECAFNMLVPLAKFVRENVNVGEEVPCVVGELKNGGYVCISDYAYPLFMPCTEGMPELNVGDYVEVAVTDINQRDTVQAEFLKKAEGSFSVNDAFADLIASYAADRVYEEEEEQKKDEQNAEVMLEESYVTELMYIIDQVALLEEERVNTYNYLAMARILALLTGQPEMADYYTRRMKFIYLLQQFVINGRVDMEQLREQGNVSPEMLQRYPLLQNRLAELRIVSCLNHPERNGFLWNVIEKAVGYKRLPELARLVLACNLLDGFELYSQQLDIRAKVREQLKLEVEEPVSYSFGEESQEVEFKSSIVYPPENGMRPDLARQTQKIMEVICGFLNAGGGTLYVGVNDKGVANGLDEDIAYFQGEKDKYDVYIRNQIVYSLGNEANSCISVFYPEAGNKLVYAMHIEPCPHPVKCNGIYYQRQGTSTWPLQGEARAAFLESRAERGGKTAAATTVPADKPQAVKTDSPTAAGTPPSGKPERTQAPAAVEEAQMFSISTSQLRPNAVHSYQEGYGENVLAYLHLLKGNGYMLTNEETWRGDVQLSLAIHEGEKSGYLVIVYESGRALRVPMAELLERTGGREYKRFSQEKTVFACPAAEDDGLLIVLRDMQERPAFRMDDVGGLKESNMLSKGEFITKVQASGVLQCEIIRSGDKPRFKRIANLKPTSIGPNLTSEWGTPEQQEFKALGIRLCFD